MILTLTLNPSIDKSTTVNGLVPEQKLRCSVPHYEPGGGGINVARAIHKLGGQARALFLAGGYSGAFFQELITNEGIPFEAIGIAGATRENFIVVDTSTNQQYRFGMDGPTVSTSECQLLLDKVAIYPNLSYVVGSGSLPLGVPSSFYGEVAKICRQKNVRLILDTSGKALQEAADIGVYLLKPNLAELSALVGVSELQLDEVDEAALHIIHKGNCEVVVVSLGAAGALLVSKEGTQHVPAPTVKKRSTVGAGDSMVAGMTLSLTQGRSLLETVRYGVACGSAATMNEGTELCNLDDVERLYARMRR
ncbi:MAG: 1-phosphofructokinase family hexose kinase [Spirosomataceae bacterium]